MLQHFVSTLIALGLLTCTSSALAADAPKRDIYDLHDIVAVQNRAYRMPESLGLGVSYLPSDAFNRLFSTNLSYSYVFGETLAWEIVNFQYLFKQDTQVKKDLLDSGFQINAGDGGRLDYPKQIITTGLVFTPLYNKSLFFNRRLVYGETAFYLGTGSAIYNQTGHRFLFTPGIQLRFYLSQNWALRAHFRDHFYYDSKQGINNMIDAGITLEIKTGFFGGRDREI